MVATPDDILNWAFPRNFPDVLSPQPNRKLSRQIEFQNHKFHGSLAPIPTHPRIGPSHVNLIYLSFFFLPFMAKYWKFYFEFHFWSLTVMKLDLYTRPNSRRWLKTQQAMLRFRTVQPFGAEITSWASRPRLFCHCTMRPSVRLLRQWKSTRDSAMAMMDWRLKWWSIVRLSCCSAPILALPGTQGLLLKFSIWVFGRIGNLSWCQRLYCTSRLKKLKTSFESMCETYLDSLNF